jgi:hypothetical protein
MPRKKPFKGKGGNAAFRSLSDKEPKTPPAKVRLYLTPLDVFGQKTFQAEPSADGMLRRRNKHS